MSELAEARDRAEGAERGEVRPRRGPRARGEATRGLILAQACEAFAQHGGSGASIRSIATSAGVDPALVHYFFGDKQSLIREAIRHLCVDQAFERFDPARPLWEELAEWYLGMWEDPVSGSRMQGLLHLAMTDGDAAAAIVDFIGERLMPHLSNQFAPGPDQEARCAMLAAKLFGIAVYRYVLKMPWLVHLSARELARLADLQGYAADTEAGAAHHYRTLQAGRSQWPRS